MNNQGIDEKVSVLKSILFKSLIVVGLGLVVGASYVAYQSHQTSKNASAAELLYSAQRMEQSDDSKPATPADLANAKFDAQAILAWDAAKRDKYLKILTDIDEKYSGTPTWALSQIRRAKIKEAQKDSETAAVLYREVIASMKAHPLFLGLASESLGVLLENSGKNEEALEVYRQASKHDKNPLRPLALMGEARVLKNLGKPGAAEVFDKIVKDYPESPYSRRATVLKASLR